MNDSKQLLRLAQRWLDDGRQIALATVISTWGSSPRPVGSQLLVDDRSRFEGSVSGGCVEGDVISACLLAMDDAQPRLLEYGVSDDQAWEVGLACGGRIRVYVEPVH